MTLSYDTLLIANRGEIARRIIASAKRLGITTVAVYSDADASAPHVRDADHSVCLGAANPADSYLSAEKVIRAAQSTGAGAIHPGYGFFSENAEFADSVEYAGIRFVGPTPQQLRVFGNKHTAREAARAVGVPLVAGSALLESAEHAVSQADQIGFPVMVKAVGGGGGIGLQVCTSPGEVREAFERVVRLSHSHFSSAGVFLERFVTHARHIEVQVFGDGHGGVVTLGTRDCSLQRRNQKVIEEAPAPAISPEIEQQLLVASSELAASVNYRSAGTVEFVFDVDRDEASFLEMNTRLQVEHPVTEAVTGVDLVEAMLRTAGDDAEFLESFIANPPPIRGHAYEARIYAEDPAHEYRPSTGTISAATFPSAARVESAIENGTQISSHYDPLLAKIIVKQPDREQARIALSHALDQTTIFGVTTNLAQLCEAIALPDVVDATQTTASLDGVFGSSRRIDIERPGTLTTIQDMPGRLGLWNVGIPPSGPMDTRSATAANTLVGNAANAALLECTLQGPALRFPNGACIAVTGAPTAVALNGVEVPMWTALDVAPNGVLDVGSPTDAGIRTYIAAAGGIAAPEYLGSKSTFALGGFGGPFGRELLAGDVLTIDAGTSGRTTATRVEPIEMGHDWTIAVTPGPQSDINYFLPEDISQLYDACWTVSGHANRTGIRLDGPKPQWSRADGGDAGLHPSNLHDNPYSVGALNISGDTPILLGPDGPSLGGFVCPVTVISTDRWKLGQLRPGDTLRFVAVSDDTAISLRKSQANASLRSENTIDDGVIARLSTDSEQPGVAYLRGGDDNVLVEYGDMTLDLALRMRVHALSQLLMQTAIPGVIDATPGVRSLHLHFDSDRISQHALVDALIELETQIGASERLSVPNRHVRLPLSFDDPSIADALDRYRAGVRSDAPWLPSNIEFIRRINGLASIDDVRDIIFSAEYLVLGLGDVYLGAPLAVPLDPRHRLVTTKYNPARTWTPADSVGIGGTYMCVYGMDSPGGYQLIGRTLPIWSTHTRNQGFEPQKPWMFRYFDVISWDPVDADELAEIRAAATAGRYSPDITESTFSLRDHQQFLADNDADIRTCEANRAAAFDSEKRAWHTAGEFARETTVALPHSDSADIDMPSGASLISAPMSGSVWQVPVAAGDDIAVGDTIAVLEAMKLELPIQSADTGRVLSLLVQPGMHVDQGTPIAVIG